MTDAQPTARTVLGYNRIASSIIFVTAVLLSLLVWKPAGATGLVSPSGLTGKMILGYQGWFACPQNGGGLGWWHWGNWSKRANPTVDMLPDVTDLLPAERCKTSATTAGGQPVMLFDSRNQATVEDHFLWMQQYGIDGVALQRFPSELLRRNALDARNAVLANVRRAAEDHGRVFFIMYDLSGKPAERAEVLKDWAWLQKTGITRSPAYLRDRGHPLVGVFGLGFRTREFTPETANELLDGLAKVSAPFDGVTVLGGVPSYWRTGKADASPDPEWNKVWPKLGVISPWSVGRFVKDAGADGYRRAVLVPDMRAARTLGIEYMPVVFPGFSWSNLQESRDERRKAAFNAAPRRCGRFFWHQVYNAISSGATMLYGAMFDEVDEGTAMFKLLPSQAQVPVRGIRPDASFVTLDQDGCHLPSDWYLRLAGAATTALTSGGRISPQLPFAIPAN